MKRRKKGFTLAETLIAIGIVGILAAVLLPQITQNIVKNQAGAVLGRAAEQFELGCQNIMQKVVTNSIDGNYAEILTNVTVGDVLGSNNSTDITSSDTMLSKFGALFGVQATNSDSYLNDIKGWGSENTSNIKASKAYSYTKLNATVFIHPNTNTPSDENPGTIIKRIYFDINGENKPNTFGKDIFAFGLTNGGRLIPAGTQAYKDVFSETALSTDGCKDNSVTDGLSCTARIVKEGYKVKYY